MMKREEQIAFMENCQQRLRGYVSNWMKDPFIRGAFHYRREDAPKIPPADNSGQAEPERKFG